MSTEWTTEAPTLPGYFWHYDPTRRTHATFLLWVKEGEAKVFGGAWVPFPQGGYWCGPIECPTLPTDHTSAGPFTEDIIRPRGSKGAEGRREEGE